MSVPSLDAIVLAPPNPVPPLRNIRSTIFISSLAAMRELGYERGYLAALPKRHHEAILGAVAGAWLPVELALAHYAAIESLGLSTDRHVEMGRRISDRVRGTILGTVVRMSRASGVTPWTIFPQFQRFWNRGFDGGGIGIVRVGPKEALIEATDCVVFESKYFRDALRGTVMGAIDLFCNRSYMHERPGRAWGTSTTFRTQWA